VERAPSTHGRCWYRGIKESRAALAVGTPAPLDIAFAFVFAFARSRALLLLQGAHPTPHYSTSNHPSRRIGIAGLGGSCPFRGAAQGLGAGGRGDAHHHHSLSITNHKSQTTNHKSRITNHKRAARGEGRRSAGSPGVREGTAWCVDRRSRRAIGRPHGSRRWDGMGWDGDGDGEMVWLAEMEPL
jgi:hypothetical protein